MSDVQGLYVFQWIWEASSQLPQDAYVNSWHFRSTPFIAQDFDNVRDLLVDFYDVASGNQPHALTYFTSNNTLSGNYTIKAYWLEDPKPRAVAYETYGAVNVNTQGTLPTENAAVFSFQAAQESGESQKRRRNRIYFGPLGANAVDNYSHLDNDLVASMLFAGRQLKEASDQAATWSWVMYSPSDDAAYPVDNGWVDNAVDTQRRRGLPSTQRGTFGAGYPS